MTMKKQIWLAAGIAGLLFVHAPADVQADIGIRLGDVRILISRTNYDEATPGT